MFGVDDACPETASVAPTSASSSSVAVAGQCAAGHARAYVDRSIGRGRRRLVGFLQLDFDNFFLVVGLRAGWWRCVGWWWWTVPLLGGYAICVEASSTSTSSSTSSAVVADWHVADHIEVVYTPGCAWSGRARLGGDVDIGWGMSAPVCLAVVVQYFAA